MMLEYNPSNLSINRRRHALKPDEAEYLTRTLHNLVSEYHGEALHRMHSHENRDGVADTQIPTAFDAFHLTSSMWKTHATTAVNRGDSLVSTPCTHNSQQYWSFPASTASEEHNSSSTSSSVQSRPDYKRKHGALSDEEDDMEPSATAINIVHPSELRPEEEGCRQALQIRERGSFQVKSILLCCKATL